MVPNTEWLLDESLDACRRARLETPPSASELLVLLEKDGVQAAEKSNVCLQWKEADGKCGFFRIEVRLALSEETFDSLFNGRSGYRAQYYLLNEGRDTSIPHAKLMAVVAERIVDGGILHLIKQWLKAPTPPSPYPEQLRARYRETQPFPNDLIASLV